MIALFRALPGLAQLGVVAAIVAALVGGYWAWHHNVYRSGYDAALTDIAAKNQEAINARDRAVQRVVDCYARGGTWDQSRGVCG